MKLVAITSLLLVGCVADSDSKSDPSTDTDTTPETDSDSDTQPETAPDTEPEPPAAPVAAGTYSVRTELDLTVEALLPERIHSMVLTLRQFSQNPAQTMFDVAEDAGVPAVQEIRDNLPEYVEDKLEGWIDGELAKITINGKSLAQHAGDLAALAETSVGKFALDSTLDITGTSATHTLGTLDLSPAGLAATFPLSALPAEVITASTTCSTTDSTVAIGAHGYAIPYGEYVWQALNAQIDVRASLGAAVNCPALAKTISNKCYWGYCVGHETELTEICEQGLDEIVERVHDEFAATKLDLVQFSSGTATLSADGRTMSGTWSAQINAGQGLRNAPATFTASK
jgi:hypothetical protein